MPLFKDDSGKTEQPTPQKLDDARDRGQAPVSRELITAVSLLAAVGALQGIGPWLVDTFRTALRAGMALGYRALEDGEPRAMQSALVDSVVTVAPPFAALLLLVAAAVALAGYGQIGLRVSSKALRFELQRLSPARNLGRLLSLTSLTKAALALVKVAVIGAVLALVLRREWTTLANLHRQPSLATAVGEILRIAFEAFAWIAVVVLALAVLDLLWQRFDYRRNLKMSKQEVDDERKRTEGDPMIKHRLRAARQELQRHRMMEAVPRADVVITNPTHFAVALCYERGQHSAPEVVAKGTDDTALRIRALAQENDVPIMEDPPLARALCRSVKIGQQIPERFFKAVAAVLSHVYRMGGRVA